MTENEWFESFKHALKISQVSLDEAVSFMKERNLLLDDVDMVDFFEFRQWLHDVRKTEKIESSMVLELIGEWHRQIKANIKRLDNFKEVFEGEPKLFGLIIHAQNGLRRARVTLGKGVIFFMDGPSKKDVDKVLESLESAFRSD